MARSSGSPHRASGTVEVKKSETFADSSAVALARTPRLQMGDFVAPRADPWLLRLSITLYHVHKTVLCITANSAANVAHGSRASPHATGDCRSTSAMPH